MNIGFDLDGIFVGTPPFMPKELLEWLYCGPQGKQPHYRFPKTKLEQFVRQLSHTHRLRPKKQKNINLVNRLVQDNSDLKIYLITSRYSFLKKQTHKILDHYNLELPFTAIYLNSSDQQPHLFKQEMIKKLKIDLFVDDDLKLLRFLSEHFPKMILLWYNPRSPFKPPMGINKIKSLEEIKNFLS